MGAPAQGESSSSGPTITNTSYISALHAHAYTDAQNAADAQQAQSNLSYRDASQILLNPRQPPYKVAAQQGLGGRVNYMGTDAEVSGLFAPVFRDWGRSYQKQNKTKQKKN
jgi:hypothetical protein